MHKKSIKKGGMKYESNAFEDNVSKLLTKRINISVFRMVKYDALLIKVFKCDNTNRF